MKKILLLFPAIASINAIAQPTRTTVQNGNALNPLTWDCTCIPALTDNIVVNHALTLDVDYGATSGSLTVNASGSITGDSPSRIIAVMGSSFVNQGTVTVAYFYHSAGSFNNSGTLTATNLMGVDAPAVCNNYGTLNVNDTLGVDIGAELHNYGTATVLVTANAGTIENHMIYNTGDIWSSGTFHNMGAGGMTSANIYTSGSFTNAALLEVSASIFNSETFTNNHQIVVDVDLWNGDTINGTATLTNNGIISIANSFYNSEDVNGTGGKFCIQNQTNNSGAISGTIDICDLTGGAIDFNVGTVAGSVTFCSTSCSIDITENEEFSLNVYPNPFENYLVVEGNTGELMECTLTDMQGRLITQTIINENGIISTPFLQHGTYVLTVGFNNGQVQHIIVTR